MTQNCEKLKVEVNEKFFPHQLLISSVSLLEIEIKFYEIISI
jgi:hypothetical protein